MLGPSSKFLAHTKLDLKKAVALLSGSCKILQVPKYAIASSSDFNEISSNLNFPLIVKPAYSLGSLFMTKASVVHTKAELKKQVDFLKTKTKEEILIEEFIAGREISVMVLETKDGIKALTPILYVFPEEWKENGKWLDFETKFSSVEKKVVDFRLMNENEDQELVKRIQNAAVAAYEAIGVFGSGYARVDLRVDGENNVYVLEVRKC
jgi:D-alanine-D-alanine ligase